MTVHTAATSSPKHASRRDPAVQVIGLTRRFASGVVAVDNVSLEIKDGELVCLLGPSGSGKTTLLRMVGGFEVPDTGRISLLGEDVTSLPPAARKTNMVFQNHALFPHLNVHDNIAFGLRMRRVRKADIGRRVSKALELVRLGGFESRHVDHLSGGQRQRVAIARAIVNDPAVLLLDEPLGALDLRLRMELQDELRRLQRSLGSPFMVVTHDQTEAMAMADRIAVMNNGRLEQVGTPVEIYSRPASLFVAQFVGRTNLLHGRIVESGGEMHVVETGGICIPCRSPRPLAVGTRVTLSVREEHVRLAASDVPQLSAECRLAATITDKSFLGSALRLGMRMRDGTRLVSEIRADDADACWAPGALVLVGWHGAQAHVFAAP